MEGESSSRAAMRYAEIERLMEEFRESFKARTSDADNFITIHEIEQMWETLQLNTEGIYTDMIRELMSEVDERELIRKKKENTHSKG